jgi:hypothetical protein
MSGASKGIRFTPLEAKTYRATLTVYVNGVALTPSISLLGTGLAYPIFSFESTVSIDSSLVERIAVADLTSPVSLVRVDIADDIADVFSVVDANHYSTGDSVVIRFTPKDAVVYAAYLTVDDERKVILTATGMNPAFYSSDKQEKWQYLQFVSTGKVITQNGDGNPLTANDLVENNGAQLWKIIPASQLLMDLLINKADPTLSIRFKEGRYLAVSGQVRPDPPNTPEDAVYLYTTLRQDKTNYFSLTRIGNLGEPLEASASRPESNNEGAILLTNEKDGVKNTPETYLRFIYHSEKNGTSINRINTIANRTKIHPNPVDEILSVEIPENVTTLSVINSLGQTVMKIKPTTIQEQLPVSHLSAGIYFLKIEDAHESGTIKFIKK